MTERSAPRVIPPKKPRRSLPFRVCRALLILFISLLALHAGWGYVADRRLDTRLREYRSAGEWVDPTDFRGVSVTPEQNAALDLHAASRLIEEYDPTFTKADNLYPFLPLTSEEDALIRAAVGKYPDVFALVESAARKPAAWWQNDYSVADVSPSSPRFAEAIARLIHRDALVAHTDGDDRRALRRVENLLDLARMLDTEPLSLAHSRAHGAADYAAWTAEQLAPDLRIGDGAGAVTVADLRRIIDRLLDDDGPRRAMIRAMWSNRRECWARARSLAAGEEIVSHRRTPDGMWLGYVLKPFLLADAELAARMTTAEVRAFERAHDWPAYRDAADLDRLFPEVRAYPTLHFWAGLLHHEPSVKVHYKRTTDCHLAATILALRCYAADHADHLPGALAHLVPTYLPAVPTDPMAPNGAPLRYRRMADDAIVYSVGEDGRDDAGSAAVRPDVYQPEDPPDRWERVDAAAHVRRQPRPYWRPYGSWMVCPPVTETPTPTP